MSDNRGQTYKFIIVFLGVIFVGLLVTNPFAQQEIHSLQSTSETIYDAELLIDADRDQMSLVSDGNYLVWQDYRNGNWDIYGYNLTSGEEFVIANTIYPEYRPKIYSTHVIWRKNIDTDIYLEGYFINNHTSWSYKIPLCVNFHDYDVWEYYVYYSFQDYIHKYNPFTDVDTELFRSSYMNDIDRFEYRNSVFTCYGELSNTYQGGREGVLTLSMSDKPYFIEDVYTPNYGHVMALDNQYGHLAFFDIDQTVKDIHVIEAGGIEKTISIVGVRPSSYGVLDISSEWVVWHNYTSLEASLMSYNLDEENVTMMLSGEREYGGSGVTIEGNYAYFTGISDEGDTDIYRVYLFGEEEETDGVPDGEDLEPQEGVEEFISNNWITIAGVVALITVLVIAEWYFYKFEHIKKMGSWIGIIVSAVIIGAILLYWWVM